MRMCLTVVPAAAAAFLGLAPIQAQTEDAAAGSVPQPLKQALRNSVTLPRGTVIHTTGNAIANARTVTVPGSATVIALWSEDEGAGRLTPHYAFSLDGSRLAGRIRETSYTLRLKFAEFDPLAGIPPVDASLGAAPGNEIYLVQCLAPALPPLQGAVTAAGARILRHMEDNTMVVQMTPQAVAQVRALPFVRWVGANQVAYKIDPQIIDDFGVGNVDLDTRVRYSIECFDAGPAAQNAVAAAIRGMPGATVDVMTPDQNRMEATLTYAQLLAVAKMNEVYFVDPWGGPGGHDMNLVRSVGGANFIESTLGFTGQGVRGEVFDSEVLTTHQEWIAGTTAPLVHSTGTSGAIGLHGTACYGINFAQGIDANARGMLPQAERGIFFLADEVTQFGGTKTRLAMNQELVNPAGAYRAVFQTSSIGSTQNTVYSTITNEVDSYLFSTDLLSTQSQSNTGNNNSRPQAWAKNIVSVGAVNHLNTANPADDTFLTAGGAANCGLPAGLGTSIGPAQDGRVKPDLCYWFDCIHTTLGTANNAYQEFNGTSAATPCTGGHFGLFFQMWHEGVWKGRGGKSTVFASRPHMMTAKAALINTAFRYTWVGGTAANASLNRNVQGWGRPDLTSLSNTSNKTFIVDEENPISPLGLHTYNVLVGPGEPNLNVTMCYKDPAGTTAATTHRINDLSLRVTSPSGVVFWGNNGLAAGNTSTSGGVSNTKDTVENVFLASPAAGLWKIEVLGDIITADGNPATAAIDAVYSIWATGCTESTFKPIPVYGYSVQSNGNQHLYRIEMRTGEATDLGLVGNSDLEGLSFGPDGRLFGITGSATATTGQLWDISIPPGSQVGGSFARSSADAGLDYYNGALYHLGGVFSPAQAANLYTLNATTGQPTLIGSGGFFADGLAIDTLGNGYATDFVFTDSLYTVNLTNGTMSLVGPLGGAFSAQTGSSFSADNTLWILTSDAKIYTINTATGAATFRSNVSVGGVVTGGWEGLAIDKYSALNQAALPAFGSTFSSTTLSRGYYFTSPYNGSIRGLRVPNESNQNVQNVEVVRFTAGAPPAFPGLTNSFVSLGRFNNQPANVIIPCDIPVGAGDIIGVLGACGTTTMANSYGTPVGPFNSSIKGLPVTLTRMGMQFNMFDEAAHDIWSEAAQAVSRVELYFTDGRNNLFLDADKAETGLNLATAPLNNTLGVTTFTTGETPAVSDPEFIAAGAQGNCLDGLNIPVNANADLLFNFDVDSVSFIYGGNAGGFTAEVYNAAGTLLDSFSQASTDAGQPAGPRTLAGTGNRRFHWFENAAGSFAPIDNVRIHARAACWVNCDDSTIAPILNVQDFACFLNRFANGDPWANCDGSTTVPILNVQDFSCFLNRFANGCN